jgi:hypothetical protein
MEEWKKTSVSEDPDYRHSEEKKRGRKTYKRGTWLRTLYRQRVPST